LILLIVNEDTEPVGELEVNEYWLLLQIPVPEIVCAREVGTATPLIKFPKYKGEEAVGCKNEPLLTMLPPM
jgi:hypothetical protein